MFQCYDPTNLYLFILKSWLKCRCARYRSTIAGLTFHVSLFDDLILLTQSSESIYFFGCAMKFPRAFEICCCADRPMNGHVVSNVKHLNQSA